MAQELRIMIPDPQFVSFLLRRIKDCETYYTNNVTMSKPFSKDKAMCEIQQRLCSTKRIKFSETKGFVARFSRH